MIQFGSTVITAQVPQMKRFEGELTRELNQLETEAGFKDTIRLEFFKQGGNDVKAQVTMPIDGVAAHKPYMQGYVHGQLSNPSKATTYPLTKDLKPFVRDILKFIRTNFTPGEPSLIKNNASGNLKEETKYALLAARIKADAPPELGKYTPNQLLAGVVYKLQEKYQAKGTTLSTNDALDLLIADEEEKENGISPDLFISFTDFRQNLVAKLNLFHPDRMREEFETLLEHDSDPKLDKIRQELEKLL